MSTIQQVVIKITILLLMLSVLVSCSKKSENSYTLIEGDSGNLAMAIPGFSHFQDHPGKELIESHCFVCHQVNSSREERIAPPMFAVKRHYLTSGISKAEFVQDIVAWCKNPSEETSRMRGAVNKFGVMPHLYFPQDTIEQIAAYMFEYDIEKPSGFKNSDQHRRGRRGKGHQLKRRNQWKNSSSQQLSIEKRGMEIAKTSQQALGKNLKTQLQKNGVIGALEFCNIEAIPITDSMATVHNATLKRVSDKPRNPNNQANEVELHHINTFKNQLAEGKEITPIYTKQGDQVEFYTPIITNGMCLLCHGTPGEELEYTNLTNIKKHYPKDKAVGYGANEVRGIWSIEFEE